MGAVRLTPLDQAIRNRVLVFRMNVEAEGSMEIGRIRREGGERKIMGVSGGGGGRRKKYKTGDAKEWEPRLYQQSARGAS